MSNVWFTSDTHLGHRNIGNYREVPEKFIREASDELAGETLKKIQCLANSLWILDAFKRLVRKRDVTWNTGDVAFTMDDLWKYAELKGIHNVVLGNHDDLPVEVYVLAFNTIRGIKAYKGMWLTHAPVHPNELRDKFNVHGHVHAATIEDWRYINICCENLQENIGEPMISLAQLKQVMANRRETRDWSVWL